MPGASGPKEACSSRTEGAPGSKGADASLEANRPRASPACGYPGGHTDVNIQIQKVLSPRLLPPRIPSPPPTGRPVLSAPPGGAPPVVSGRKPAHLQVALGRPTPASAPGDPAQRPQQACPPAASLTLSFQVPQLLWVTVRWAQGRLGPTRLQKLSPGPYGWPDPGSGSCTASVTMAWHLLPPFFSPLASKPGAGAEDTPLSHCPRVPRSLT